MDGFSVAEYDFSLADTLRCGQCFRWKENENGGFTGVAGGKQISICQSENKLEISGCREDDYHMWLRDYLGLSIDYKQVKDILSADPTLKQAIQYAPGIHIMRQPLWETLCSFIISQNNNITRIMGIIDRLCENFGCDLGGYYSFPSPERLAALSPPDLSPLRCGFRDRYIIDAAVKYSDGTINEHFIKTAPLDDARAMLMRITGVGRKVADCTLLFGAGRLDAFPVDVWIKRAMDSLFTEGLPDFALPYAGIAQQYIFHYARTSGLFDKK